jgi:competence protein ComEA
VVHICGAVKNEGVYKVTVDDRICDVIKMAGGGLAGADFSSLNLAEKVKEGQKIAIPFKAMLLPETKVSGALPQAAKKQKRINLNTASLAELDELPGVGPATAKKIIAARPFARVEDIMKVKRFGKSKFEKIKDRIEL